MVDITCGGFLNIFCSLSRLSIVCFPTYFHLCSKSEQLFDKIRNISSMLCAVVRKSSENSNTSITNANGLLCLTFLFFFTSKLISMPGELNPFILLLPPGIQVCSTFLWYQTHFSVLTVFSVCFLFQLNVTFLVFLSFAFT